MKEIIDVTEEGLKYAKLLCMSGLADGFHEAIANGIPVIDGSELASLLIDMRINGDIHDTTFIVSRSDDTYNNEVIVKRYKADEVYHCPECGSMIKKAESEEKPKSEWEHDHEILKAYSDGANDVLDKIKAGIEKIPTAFATAYTVKSEALKIIDKYKAEWSGEE